MKLNFSHIKLAAAALTATLILSGCAFTYAPDPGFGDSVRGAISKQVVHKAGAKADGVSPGFEGPVADSTIENYMKSFDQPAPLDNVLSIGIGSSGGSAGSSVGSSVSSGGR